MYQQMNSSVVPNTLGTTVKSDLGNTISETNRAIGVCNMTGGISSDSQLFEFRL